MSRDIGTGMSLAALKAKLRELTKPLRWRAGDEKRAKEIQAFEQESPAWRGWGFDELPR